MVAAHGIVMHLGQVAAACAWTKVRIEVRGSRASLYVHGQQQPTLIVNDVKTGAEGRGAVALWIGPGTIAHFRDLRVEGTPGSTR